MDSWFKNSPRSPKALRSRVKLIGTATAVAALLAACGGGGSPDVAVTPQLKGTALSGAALKNAVVQVYDSAGKKCATAQADNATGVWAAGIGDCGAAPYLIEVSGVTQKEGVAVVFHSAATGADVSNATQAGNSVNASQLTTVQVKLALKSDDPTAHAQASGVSSLTTENLKAASDQLLAALPADAKSEIASNAGQDIRTMPVQAGSGKGLDNLLDRVPQAQMSIADGTLLAVVTGYGADQTGSVAVGATVSSTGALAPITAPAEINGVSAQPPSQVTPQSTASITPEASAQTETALLVADVDNIWRTKVPASSAERSQFSDACYLDNGGTKKFNADRYDGKLDRTADYMKAANAYRVGAKRSNFKLVSLVVSGDKKTKTAVVSYDIAYADGTKALNTLHTLIWGDSSALCAANGLTDVTPENRPTWRYAGDGGAGRKVNIDVWVSNLKTKTFSLTDGTQGKASTSKPTDPVIAPIFSRLLRLDVNDPRGLGYTYAVVTGPLLPTAGVVLILPKAYNDPEGALKGKSSHFLNNTNLFEGARMCATASGQTGADLAADKVDCVKNGLRTNSWTLSDTDIDKLTGNDTYTYKVYAGEGWKTVNGFASETPALTYTKTLHAKPFKSTYAQSAYPEMDVDEGISQQDFLNRAKVNEGAAADLTVKGALTAATVPEGALPRAFTVLWNYSRGRATADATWPQYRKNDREVLSPKAQTFSLAVKGKLAQMHQLDYTEVGLSTSDRNGHNVETVYEFR